MELLYGTLVYLCGFSSHVLELFWNWKLACGNYSVCEIHRGSVQRMLVNL